MSLPVEQIFARMLVRYGSDWERKWEGILDMGSVKADWAEALCGFSVQSITHGLLHLPESPPNAVQFTKLCLGRPEPAPPRLPAPKANPQRVAEIVADLRAKQSARKPRQWAQELREREQQGDALTEHQSNAWRAALRDHHEGPSGAGHFTPIQNHALPPGMRS